MQHDATLTGDGTAGAPLGIAIGGVANSMLGADSVTADKISGGQVVKSLNGLKDTVTLAAGANTMITSSGNTLTIASDGLVLPFSGSANSANPLFAVSNAGTGQAVSGNSKGYGLFGGSTGTGTGAQGVRGESTSSAGFGVVGYASAASGFTRGVFGQSDSSGGQGVGGYSPGGSGVVGTSVSGYGLYGVSSTGDAGHFDGNVGVAGNLAVTGTLSFAPGQLVTSLNDLTDKVTLPPARTPRSLPPEIR